MPGTKPAEPSRASSGAANFVRGVIGREIAFDEVKLFAKRHLRQHRRRALGRRPSGVLRQCDLLRRLRHRLGSNPVASAAAITAFRSVMPVSVPGSR